MPEWEEDLEDERRLRRRRSRSGSKATRNSARDLGIRTGQAAIVSGPDGTRTLQDGPSLAQIEGAIAEVEGPSLSATAGRGRT